MTGKPLFDSPQDTHEQQRQATYQRYCYRILYMHRSSHVDITGNFRTAALLQGSRYRDPYWNCILIYGCWYIRVFC